MKPILSKHRSFLIIGLLSLNLILVSLVLIKQNQMAQTLIYNQNLTQSAIYNVKSDLYRLENDLNEKIETSTNLFYDTLLSTKVKNDHFEVSVSTTAKSLFTNEKVYFGVRTDKGSFKKELDSQGQVTISIPFVHAFAPYLSIESSDRVQVQNLDTVYSDQLFVLSAYSEWNPLGDMDQNDDNLSVAFSKGMNQSDFESSDIKSAVAYAIDTTAIDTFEGGLYFPPDNSEISNADRHQFLDFVTENGIPFELVYQTSSTSQDSIYQANIAHAKLDDKVEYAFCFVFELNDGLVYCSQPQDAPRLEVNSSSVSGTTEFMAIFDDN